MIILLIIVVTIRISFWVEFSNIVIEHFDKPLDEDATLLDHAFWNLDIKMQEYVAGKLCLTPRNAPLSSHPHPFLYLPTSIHLFFFFFYPIKLNHLPIPIPSFTYFNSSFLFLFYQIKLNYVPKYGCLFVEV
ncbi:unnamed protein product [Absidia cylindrospora]